MGVLTYLLRREILALLGFILFLSVKAISLHGETSQLVDIEKYVPGIQIDLKYATEDNFTGQIVYTFKRCLLVKEAAERLRNVQTELASLGLG